MLILNIAAGKFKPLPITIDMSEDLLLPRYIVNVDTAYFSKTPADEIEDNALNWENDPDRITQNYYLNMGVFKFMERTRLMFDRVVIYRFLEHITFTQVEYFIYLVSTILKKKGMVDVIVPNYETLAKLLLSETKYQENPTLNFEAHNIELTTELLNEPSCPHASIWTPHRMTRFWHQEGKFEVKNDCRAFNFDGRNIYLRSIIERI